MIQSTWLYWCGSERFTIINERASCKVNEIHLTSSDERINTNGPTRRKFYDTMEAIMRDP